ncbi:MAG: hypothetical protein U0X87_12900 [Anaerolineales bacterium]
MIWHEASTARAAFASRAFEGEIALARNARRRRDGTRHLSQNVRANAVIVAGAVRGNITTQKLEIRGSGRVGRRGDKSCS